MPVKAKPPEKPPVRNPVKVVGRQEEFQADGEELAHSLGWEGDPDWVANEIRVQDATAFIVKSLHEAHIAGALGHEPRDPALVSQHLGLEDAADLALVAEFMTAAYESGKGQEVTEVEGSMLSMSAALVQTPGKVG